MEPLTSTTEWTQQSFTEISKVVSDVAVRAGAIVLEALATSDQHVHHKGLVDLVTDTGR